MLQLSSGVAPATTIKDASKGVVTGPPPSFVLAFLPRGERLQEALEAMETAWPDAVRFGCETVTQFANANLTGDGVIQLFWLESADSSVQLKVIDASERIDEAARSLARAGEECDGAFIIADGLRFPIQPFLSTLRMSISTPTPRIAGGLASQQEPLVGAGARVFSGTTLHDSACLCLLLNGVTVEIEVVRGWDPASPIYEVTRAEGNVVHEIDGRSAVDWYKRFFTVGERVAPMPESAHRFPLILEGPRPERHGLIRSMQKFDEPAGAVTYWGDLQKGDLVRLGMGDGGSLVETAARLSAEHQPDAAVLYSCVGREMVLGENAAREASTIHDVLGGTALSGFFTFGEIGPSARGGLAFYNHTAILALLREEVP